MAIYRKINTNFWSDPFVCDLPPEKKLFFLYLITNERTKQCGIYDISKRQISFDLSIDLKTVTENIDFFTSHNKIMFSERTNEIAIRNWERYNGSTSPKVVKCVESELKLVKNHVLIDYIYSINTLSQQEETPTPTQEETPAKEESKEDVLFSDLENPTPPPKVEKIDYEKLKVYFNANNGTLSKIQVLSEKRKRSILALMKKFTKDDFIKVLDKTKKSDFLQGANNRTWKADFDWILNQNNFIKILEGNYDNENKIQNGKSEQQQSTNGAKRSAGFTIAGAEKTLLADAERKLRKVEGN